MQLTSFLQDGKLTVALVGEIDHHRAKEYMQAIARKIEAYCPAVCVLDFQEVTFMGYGYGYTPYYPPPYYSGGGGYAVAIVLLILVLIFGGWWFFFSGGFGGCNDNCCCCD